METLKDTCRHWKTEVGSWKSRMMFSYKIMIPDKIVTSLYINKTDYKLYYMQLHCTLVLLGSTVVSPYVGMARKQNGGYNASISVQTLIFHLVVNSTRPKTVRSALWRCPNSTVALRLLENVVKVTNLEVVKSSFVIFLFFLLLLLLQPA